MSQAVALGGGLGFTLLNLQTGNVVDVAASAQTLPVPPTRFPVIQHPLSRSYSSMVVQRRMVLDRWSRGRPSPVDGSAIP
jgi:hypothetical protein